MTDRLVVRRDTYYDSVTLMLASRDAEAVSGVEFAAAVTATPVNLELLSAQGFDLSSEALGPNDMIVAIRAADEAAADEAHRTVDSSLEAVSVAEREGGEAALPRSLRAAARDDPLVNVAFISVPGRFAAYEVASALDAGLNVFCFSDGMTLADEAALKKRAVDAGLLLMGADCGTAVIDGVSFGFANALRRGPIGIIGASGTGIQQVTCLLDSAGVGISHAIGVGGRDLSKVVGGTMTLHALDLLAGDPDTDVIAVISKPPDPDVAAKVAERAAGVEKPVVLGFLGGGDLGAPSGVEVAGSLEATARRSAELCGDRIELDDLEVPDATTPGGVRGLFCGGSLCEEAAQVVREREPNAIFLDYGDDEFTQGRAHPMIDPSLRNQRFESDVRDPRVGAIVLDVVLGFGAHPDPAADLGPRIERAIRERNGEVSVVVALCGASGDSQDVSGQAKTLVGAGALVTRNAAHAARIALAATGGSL